MQENEGLKEITTVILAAVVLALVVAFANRDIFLISTLSFLIIIGSNLLTKKIVGYHFETKVTTSFWKMFKFGFRKDSHFKFPLPMIWVALVLALFSKGILWFLAVLEFDFEAKSERVSRRHGLYRFSQVTEWHVAWIAAWGVITNLILAVVSYLLGFELLAKLSVYYAAWSMIPFSSLDGTKILFGSRVLWIILAAVTAIFLSWAFVI